MIIIFFWFCWNYRKSHHQDRKVLFPRHAFRYAHTEGKMKLKIQLVINSFFGVFLPSCSCNQQSPHFYVYFLSVKSLLFELKSEKIAFLNENKYSNDKNYAIKWKKFLGRLMLRVPDGLLLKGPPWGESLQMSKWAVLLALGVTKQHWLLYEANM